MSTAAAKPVHAANASPAEPVFLSSLYGINYSTYGTKRETFLLSFVIHTGGILLLLFSGMFVATHQQEIKAAVTNVIDISPYLLPQATTDSGGGGGGGSRDKLTASAGRLPKPAMEQLAPPQAVVRNPQPILPAEPTVIAPPELAAGQVPQIGDPLAGLLAPSSGTGSGGGIGSGSGGGIGSGRGAGVGPGWGGGVGGGPFRVGGGVSAPRALFAPDPEYSEEARKAKYQGTVLLWVVVGADGRPQSIRVQRSLGMGLDEKALEAVRQWRFEPARKDGTPVPVQINVEVNFRLY
ncbi:MAG: energy transducer TonB [Candidatus Korobacteraceae bacterium]